MLLTVRCGTSKAWWRTGRRTSRRSGSCSSRTSWPSHLHRKGGCAAPPSVRQRRQAASPAPSWRRAPCSGRREPRRGRGAGTARRRRRRAPAPRRPPPAAPARPPPVAAAPGRRPAPCRPASSAARPRGGTVSWTPRRSRRRTGRRRDCRGPRPAEPVGRRCTGRSTAAAQQVDADQRLPRGGDLALVVEVGRREVPRHGLTEDRQEQTAQRKGDLDPAADAGAPGPHRQRPSRYPTPRTVRTTSGVEAARSIRSRSRRTSTSSSRVSAK